MTMIRAGVSDKYGKVHVERIGNTGFDDVTEPVALLRAQDDLAYGAMIDYLLASKTSTEIPPSQLASVQRQVDAFRAWRREHPDKCRKPGTVPA